MWGDTGLPGSPVPCEPPYCPLILSPSSTTLRPSLCQEGPRIAPLTAPLLSLQTLSRLTLGLRPLREGPGAAASRAEGGGCR